MRAVSRVFTVGPVLIIAVAAARRFACRWFKWPDSGLQEICVIFTQISRVYDGLSGELPILRHAGVCTGKWPVEVRRNAGLCPFFLVEGGVERPVKIFAHQIMENAGGVQIVPPAKEMEPF